MVYFKRNVLESLVVVAGLRSMSECLADVTVGAVPQAAVVGGVGGRVGRLGLGGAVLRVVLVEAVADVAEHPWMVLFLGLPFS